MASFEKFNILIHNTKQPGFAGLRLLIVLAMAIFATSGILVAIQTGLADNYRVSVILPLPGHHANFAASIHPRGPAVEASLPAKPRVLSANTTLPSNQQISIQASPDLVDSIKQVLNDYLARELFQGQKGDKGDAGLAFANTSNNQTTVGIGSYPMTSYYQPNPSNNFTGASVLGISQLSSQDSATNNQIIHNNLTVSGSATTDNLTVNGTSTLQSLTVAGQATAGNLTVNGTLSVSSSSVANVLPSVAGSLVGVPNIAMVDSAGNVGQNTSLALGSDGFARIAYLDITNNALKFARCLDANCNTKNINTVDPAATIGATISKISLKLGSDGFARIAYVNVDFFTGDHQLKFVLCGNVDCTPAQATITIISVNDGVTTFGGDSPSLLLDNANKPSVVYRSPNGNGGSLILARFVGNGGTGCSTTAWTCTTIVSPGDAPDAKFDSQGNIDIAYQSGKGLTGFGVSFIKCPNAACSGAVPTTIVAIDPAKDFRLALPSLALDSQDLPRIAFHNDSFFSTSPTGTLFFTVCSTANCSSFITSALDTGVLPQSGPAVSLVLASDNTPRIAYFSHGLKYIQCATVSCDNKNISVIDGHPGLIVGEMPSLALGSDGFGRISYYDRTNGDLKFARLTTASGLIGTTGSVLGSSVSSFAQIFAKELDTSRIVFPSNDPLAFTLQDQLGTAVLQIDSSAKTLNLGSYTVNINGANFLPNGNLGIGTATPGSTLTVAGTGLFTNRLIATSQFNLVPTTGSPGYSTFISIDSTNFNTQFMGSMAGGNDFFIIQATGTNDSGILKILTGDNGTEPIVFSQMNGATELERMRIDAFGNVGIGAAAPPAPLTAVKLFSGTPFVNVASFQDQQTGQPVANIYTLAKQPTVQIVGGDNNGNAPAILGIIQPTATTSGNAIIQLDSSNSNTTQLNANVFTALNAGQNLGQIFFGGDNGVNIRNSGASITAIATANWSSTSTSGSLNFATTPQGSLGAINRMTITDSGNVGIGTTSPVDAISITGNNNNLGFYDASGNMEAQIQTTGQNGQLTFNFATSSGSTVTGSNFVDFRFGAAARKLFIGANDASSFIESINPMSFFVSGSSVPGTSTPPALYITPNSVVTGPGKIGIGTTSPTAQLFVQGTGTNNAFAVASSSGTQFLTITPAGNVGIGTSAPPHLITLSGGAFSDGAAWTNASDAGLKENFAAVTPADILQKIAALPVSMWNYKGESASSTHIGPTAQNFYTAFHLNGQDGQTSISTIDPSGVALLGIKALNDKLLTLQGSLTGNATSASLSVYSPSSFSGDSVGEARILAGQTSVRISFKQAYGHQPVVTADILNVFMEHNISDVMANGFNINIPNATATNITFAWHSFASPDEQLTVSDGSTQNIVLISPVADAPVAGVIVPAASPTGPQQSAGMQVAPQQNAALTKPASAAGPTTTSTSTSTSVSDAAAPADLGGLISSPVNVTPPPSVTDLPAAAGNQATLGSQAPLSAGDNGGPVSKSQ